MYCMKTQKINAAWSKQELAILSKCSTPDRAQDLVDSLPYRCEDGHLSAKAALRDGRAHCFDGSLLAAAALKRGKCEPFLIDLCAEDDDDHMICAYKWRGYWGAVAKSNFPGLRFREPIFKSPRELVLSYFELYFSMKGDKSLRAFSSPFKLPDPARLDWECDDSVGDKIVEMLGKRRHFNLLTTSHHRTLRKVDDRLFKSQLLGVNLKGVY